METGRWAGVGSSRASYPTWNCRRREQRAPAALLVSACCTGWVPCAVHSTHSCDGGPSVLQGQAGALWSIS